MEAILRLESESDGEGKLFNKVEEDGIVSTMGFIVWAF